jgi:hypothetical protein
LAVLSFGLLVIPQGQLAQPTNLGFCTIIGGLIIASMTINTPIGGPLEDSEKIQTI